MALAAIPQWRKNDAAAPGASARDPRHQTSHTAIGAREASSKRWLVMRIGVFSCGCGWYRGARPRTASGKRSGSSHRRAALEPTGRGKLSPTCAKAVCTSRLFRRAQFSNTVLSQAHAPSRRRSQHVPKPFPDDETTLVHEGNGLGTPSAHLRNACSGHCARLPLARSHTWRAAPTGRYSTRWTPDRSSRSSMHC